jgi:hypothetical protein
MYDPKPDAPMEYRGEFDAIATKLPGVHFCEYMPLQAQIADKFSVLRGMKVRGRHDAYELLSGNPSERSGEIRTAEKWPVFGSVVSRLHADRTQREQAQPKKAAGEQASQPNASAAIPPYVNLNDLRENLLSR